MLTMGHEFHHYYLNLKGKWMEKSMAIESFVEEQAAVLDLEEFKSVS
jgi:hypothetical protein